MACHPNDTKVTVTMITGGEKHKLQAKETVMGKNLLVAIDGSRHANNALCYASGYQSHAGETHFTLINIQPIISDYVLEESRTDVKMKEALARLNSDNEANSYEVLKKSKEMLIEEGIASSDVKIVSQTRMIGLTKDILEYSHKHQCDAIFAGRRGLTRLQKLFMGSTSTKLMEHSGKMPLCIVDGAVRPRNILVAVDMGASSVPIINFISRFFDRSHDYHFTFFHVFENFSLNYISPFTPGIIEMEEIFETHKKQAIGQLMEEIKQELTKCGIEENQYEIKTAVRTTKTARMIVEEVENNDYDTVVIGRTGRGKAFYFGSVSRYISERMTDHAIWLIG